MHYFKYKRNIAKGTTDPGIGALLDRQHLFQLQFDYHYTISTIFGNRRHCSETLEGSAYKETPFEEKETHYGTLSEIQVSLHALCHH